MSLSTIKSYNLRPAVFTRESMFSIAELLDARARQLVATERTDRSNADQSIVNNFTAQIQALTTELAQVRLLADSLGDAELAQMEDSLLRVLNQPTFADLISGGTLEGFKLNSIVRALASQPDEAYTERDAVVHGVATVITMGFTDGRRSTMTAALTPVPANVDAGTPERLVYTYTTNDFLGLPAVQTVTYNVARFTGSDKLWLEEHRNDLILFDISANFMPAGPAPKLLTPDLNSDGVIGINTAPPAPPVDRVALTLATLQAKQADKAAADAQVIATASAVAAAQADVDALVGSSDQAAIDAAAGVLLGAQQAASAAINAAADATTAVAVAQAAYDAALAG
jgi:hypothetical protein